MAIATGHVYREEFSLGSEEGGRKSFIHLSAIYLLSIYSLPSALRKETLASATSIPAGRKSAPT